MGNDIILDAVPNADPVFVHLLSRLPDPPKADYATMREHLRALHRIYEEKRRAADDLDEDAWNAVVEKEVRVIQYADVV